MEDLYRTTHPSQGNDKDHEKRKLKRLRSMLIFWFISFVIVVLWFYLSSND